MHYTCISCVDHVYFYEKMGHLQVKRLKMSHFVFMIWFMYEFKVAFSIISVVWIITRSRILASFRDKLDYYPLYCDQCLAFWLGIALTPLFTRERQEFLIIWWSVSGFGFLSAKIFPNKKIKAKDLPPIMGVSEEKDGI